MELATQKVKSLLNVLDHRPNLSGDSGTCQDEIAFLGGYIYLAYLIKEA